MTTAAVDLGQMMGWVKGDIVGPMTYGTFTMPQTTNLGKWLKGMDAFCRQLLPGVTSLAVEQPFLGQDYFPARKLISALGHLHYWSGFYGVLVVQEIAISSGKLNLSGSGAADAPRMIAAAKERYGLDLDEHQAHALGIWDVFQMGKTPPIPKAKSRSSKGVVIAP